MAKKTKEKDRSKTYDELYTLMLENGYSTAFARKYVFDSAYMDIYHHGNKRWMKESGQLAAAEKWVNKGRK